MSDMFLHLFSELTLDEKIALVSGHGLWRTAAIDRLGIPSIIMTDGTYGVRYSVEQIDGPGDNQLEQFLSVVASRESDAGAAAFGTTKQATCFPNGSSLGCSWDVDLAHELGEALAIESRSMGVDLLLGPGINIRRTPLAGRSYEYYSEDPYVTGDIAAGVISGLQANGVGASLKHFACNNSEIERTSMDSVVSERALREIYLKGFERAIDQSDPWTVMSSYNRLNGKQAAESHWLLTTVLRDQWGYGGCVVSDWHGIKDRATSLLAGNDLDMPESSLRKRELERAVQFGNVAIDVLDGACRRILRLIGQCVEARAKPIAWDSERHHQLARDMAAKSIVLLRNEAGALPLDPRSRLRLLVVGPTATAPIIQGSGCATTRPTRVDIPLVEIKALAGPELEVTYCDGVSSDGAVCADAIEHAQNSDHVIVFVNTDVAYDGEGSDRTTLSLAAGQDELVSALARVQAKTTVVITSPDAVTMPWLEDVSSVFMAFFAGQGFGSAIARLLFGVDNPGAKLSVSLPRRIEDIPGWHTYPGENGRHLYAEDIFVGYRYYDVRATDPLFPFGFGLSYTDFSYSDLTCSVTALGEQEAADLSVTVRNDGAAAGAEIVQVYARWTETDVKRPVRELKAFRRVFLAPGEERRLSLRIQADDLRYYDTTWNEWMLEKGSVALEVSRSSRQPELSTIVEVRPTRERRAKLSLDTTPGVVLDTPGAEAALTAFISQTIGIGEPAAAEALAQARHSFIGIYNSLCWAWGDLIEAGALQSVLDDINRGSDHG